MIKHTKETILGILHGFHDLKMIDGQLFKCHKDTPQIDESIQSFEYGSFTYQLLTLIEAHLNGYETKITIIEPD